MKYIVKKGDTLYKIANRFGLTVNGILALNPQLEKDDYLYSGQIINLADSNLMEYSAQLGDTIYAIAEKFDLRIDHLLKANPDISNPDRITIGQTIYIPKSISSEIVQTNQEYSYEDLTTSIEALKTKYPFIHTEIIGSSVMGKPIYALRLGRGEKEVFYSGNWHANEYLTGQLLMKFVEDYAKAYSQNRTLRGYDINYLYHHTSIWIVPMVNPDGTELVIEGILPSHPYYQTVLDLNYGSKNFKGWTANIRGVDLNHQWPADWEEENERSPQVPSPRKYGGTQPLTEPETIAVYEFTRKHHFRMVLAFHSQGQVIYWGFKGMEPPESKKIVNRFAVLTGYLTERTAYSGAGFKDWFIQEYRKPGFTIEVGIGTNPLPVTQFSQIYRENLTLLLEAPLL
ncbi:M14 family metallopeptidase [Tepidibacillus fermentans]|uniref:Gamma-D-glutamyl-(L)-meso-diaminopimelate peptidase I n=1 Tax=Tepidibacillus fermentans TaxID=1281767 RepID=A0A4R3KK00_9BACI|nr:M14 family metallopeptidase [Tepidibacillus fermentans]TCS84103.1 gamma-D-glutamyl-{L}-meso-diaminopimelate peptidase I [Tepidibacillus fermentans]